MTNKLKILIVDDVDAQIKEIMACMLPHEGDLYADDVVNLAKKCFDFVTFKSVGEAINYLENKEYRPDLAFCDLNFEHLHAEKYPESERHPQKGIDLITWLRKHRPETKVVLHTLYLDVNIKIIRQYSDIVFPINRTFEDFKSGIQGNLREIAQKYCQKMGRDAKKVASFHRLMEAATTTDGFLAKEVEVGSEKYGLKYLLIGWAKAYYEDEPILYFPDLADLKETIKPFFVLESAIDFGGNLRNNNILRIINSYLIHPNHDEWRDTIRKNALLILKETVERWNGNAVKNPTLENPTLKTISTNLDNIVNGNSNLDGTTVEVLLRLLTCRLIVTSIWHLATVNVRNKYLKAGINEQQSINFAILAILKNNASEFNTYHEAYRNCLKKNQKMDVHRNVKKVFTTQLGLRGSLTNVQEIDLASLLSEEKEWLTMVENQVTSPN